MTLNRDYLKIKRICRRKYLNFIYAPNGKRGKYFVYSEVSHIWVGELTITGHVVRINGKPRRVWFS